VDPLVLTDQGHFFTGLQTHPGPAGTSVYGTHVEYQTPESVRDNLVLVHGGGGQALDMLTTPDGRPGWSTIFLRDGFAVYTVDRPGLGRSPFHPDVYGPYGPPAAYEGFVASFAGASPPGLPPTRSGRAAATATTRRWPRSSPGRSRSRRTPCGRIRT